MEKIAVHFGAGNIGRGFIGMLLAQAGYKVVFVDVIDRIVAELHKRNAYTVELAGEDLEQVRIAGVDARLSSDPELAELLASASLITTAVGANVLVHVAKSIVASLTHVSKNAGPQYIIACENMIRASSVLKRTVEEQLGSTSIPAPLKFLDAAVDRVVPIMQHEDPLLVRVEQYHEWLVEGLPAELPDLDAINGLNLVPDLTPFLKRKIYTVNTGHACAAWHGFRRAYKTVNEALADSELKALVSGALAESSAALCAEYGLNLAEQQEYVQKVLKRFQNPFIVDDVLRVGRQPLRKLGVEERIDGPLKLAQKHGYGGEFLLRGAAAALSFRNAEDAEACQLEARLEALGLDAFLAEELAHFGAKSLAQLKQYCREYAA